MAEKGFWSKAKEHIVVQVSLLFLNSFNSMKGLTYFSSHYIPIAKWFDGGGELPASHC